MKTKMSPIINFGCIFMLLATGCLLMSKANSQTSQGNSSDMRIVSLSPHLTELVFLLGLGDKLIAVSDYSDFPEAAQQLPSVASYQGANLEAIYRLQATHVLAWKGGNKHSDIIKLKDAGYRVYQSDISDIASWLNDIKELSAFLDETEGGKRLVDTIETRLSALKLKYGKHSKRVFYYLSDTPLMALGNDKWLNDVLSLCQLSNVFKESLAGFPQVSREQVIRQRPEVLIASNHASTQSLYRSWEPHEDMLNARFLRANPDKLHRFTPRAIDEMFTLCEKVYAG